MTLEYMLNIYTEFICISKGKKKFNQYIYYANINYVLEMLQNEPEIILLSYIKINYTNVLELINIPRKVLICIYIYIKYFKYIKLNYKIEIN